MYINTCDHHMMPLIPAINNDHPQATINWGWVILKSKTSQLLFYQYLHYKLSTNASTCPDFHLNITRTNYQDISLFLFLLIIVNSNASHTISIIAYPYYCKLWLLGTCAYF